jgi:hypothetical protein
MSYGDRPRVTPHEFEHQVRPALMSHGFNEHQINQVAVAFQSSLQQNSHLPNWKPGVDKETLYDTMSYMRAHPGASTLGEHHWAVVEQVMQKHI